MTTPRPRARSARSDGESTDGAARSAAPRPSLRSRAIALPIAVLSSIAVALGIAQPADAAPQPPKRQPKAKSNPAGGIGAAAAAAEAVPAEVVVADGDTVSSIAERFGLSTAEVLAANGLGWSSLIFPGQRLVLPGGAAPVEPVATGAPEIARHAVAAGETLSGIAAQYGVELDQLLSVNGLSRESLIFPGQQVVLPGPAPVPTLAPEAPSPDGATPAEQVTVVEGDTAWGIAEAVGVDLDALLAANGLDRDSTLQPGQVLVVPRAVRATLAASVSVVLTDEMRQNAKIVIDVGRSLGVPDQGIVVALAAAAQESGLRNVHHGDLDSLGLFQQRPSQGWGTVEQVLDPVRAATAFYGGAANPNPGATAGLLDIPGWESMSVTQAAQAVQQSAYPDHYAKWEQSARAWLSELG